MSDLLALDLLNDGSRMRMIVMDIAVLLNLEVSVLLLVEVVARDLYRGSSKSIHVGGDGRVDVLFTNES